MSKKFIVYWTFTTFLYLWIRFNESVVLFFSLILDFSYLNAMKILQTI